MVSPLLHPVVLPTAWTQPEMLIPFGGLVVAFGGLLLAACQSLKSEINNSETRQREEMKAGEVRQREALLGVKGELHTVKEELKGLGDKLDRVVESLLASRA